MASELDLGKQIGPLPLGAWIAVVAGGLGIALYTRNGGGGEGDPEVVEDIGSPDGVGTGEVGGWTPTEPSNDLPQGITNNDEWGNQAINFLIAQGYQPDWSYSAITKALAGGAGANRLNAREYSLWRVALRKFGAPPYPVNVPSPSPLPTPTPPNPIIRHTFVPKDRNPDGYCKRCGKKYNNYVWHFRRRRNQGIGQPAHQSPARFRYARVTAAPLPGSTLKSLAQIYYRDSSKWNRIYQANRAGQRRADGSPGLIENPNRLRVGWKLIIPR